jgi:tight adherence protein B
MQISAEPIIYILIFVGVLALVEGLYLTVFGKSISLNSRVNRRLDMLEKGAGREQVLEQLRKEVRQHINAQGIPLYSLLADKAQKANIASSSWRLTAKSALSSLLAAMDFSASARDRARPASATKRSASRRA